MAALQEHLLGRAARHPAALAVSAPDGELTHGQLDAASSRLARALREAGCRAGDRVALLLPRGATSITATLAVLKAGGVCVPLDARAPAIRSALVLADARPAVILACAETAATLKALRGFTSTAGSAVIGWLGPAPDGRERPRILNPAAFAQAAFTQADVDAQSSAPLLLSGAREERTHLLYTVDATGRPASLVLRHRTLAAFAAQARDRFGLRPGDRTSADAGEADTAGVFHTLAALAAGASVHVQPAEADANPALLTGFIRSHNLTQWTTGTKRLAELAEGGLIHAGDFPALRRVFWHGTALASAVLRHLMERLPHVRFTGQHDPNVPSADQAADMAASLAAGAGRAKRPARPAVIGNA
ncbi:AMP-binding protein [Azospirillum sp. SYSU D00513]|uniref:AMP-binding protein n=1 Tax=Azospirillum sp. SYSU D00513 TaxID=2812561 RepID=UPI001A978BF2|nr:AMP-binding protein [Azospirillum sp. SYSU D00513]